MPNFLEIGASKAEIKKLDRGIKNRWRDDWLKETDNFGKPVHTWCRKLTDKPGVAFCLLCQQDIRYGQNGKKVLLKHANEDKTHQKAVRQQALTQTLPG